MRFFFRLFEKIKKIRLPYYSLARADARKEPFSWTDGLCAGSYGPSKEGRGADSVKHCDKYFLFDAISGAFAGSWFGVMKFYIADREGFRNSSHS